MLMATGLGAVSYQLNNGSLVLSGVYDQRKETEFRSFISHVKHLPSITSVKDLAVPTSPNMAAIDLSSHYQVSGISFHDGKGFNAIVNGRMYMLGDAVDGMRVVDIEEKMVLLEKDGVKYRIDYTSQG
jgi:hypothetical protein